MILFVGLGLIGGSMAKALRGFEGMRALCVDRDPDTRAAALCEGVVEAAYADAAQAPVERADVIVLCLHPQGCVDFLRAHGARVKPGALVTDVCGVKRPVFEAARAYLTPGAHFVGGHPMAGKEHGGYANATGSLFVGAHYILVQEGGEDAQAVARVERMARAMGCADVIRTDPLTHDLRVAYTSQMMHVLAVAICEQDALEDSYGFEGGSFRGTTRVAALDPDLWTELFWPNRDALAQVTEELIGKLQDYAALLRGGEREALRARLAAASARKEAYNRANRTR